MRVREASVSDIPALVRLEQECFGREKFSEHTLMAFVLRDDAFALVAEHEGRVLGASLCVFSSRRREGRIASMAVSPCERRAGVARALLSESEGRLKQEGVSLVGLEVDVKNKAAIDLYLTNGYVVSATVKDYYGRRRHAYVMEKPLPSTKPKVTVRPS